MFGWLHRWLSKSPCPACGSVGQRPLIDYPSRIRKWKRLKIAICQSCGFGWVPRVPFSLDEYYAEQYGSTQNRHRYPAPKDFFESIHESNTRITRRARGHASILTDLGVEAARVLDVGAGVGAFLYLWPAEQKLAVESDPVSFPYLEHVGAERIPFERLWSERFDLVVASHFLEHLLVEQVDEFLQAVARALTPSGAALIEVPEWGRVHTRKLPKRQGHEPHTLFFSPEALLCYLDRADFRVEYFKTGKRRFHVGEDGSVDLEAWTPHGKRDSTHLVAVVRSRSGNR